MRREPQQTQLVQIALHHMGYPVLVDGVWGPKTQSAFDDYLTKNPLTMMQPMDRPNHWKRVKATYEEAQQLARSPWLGDNFPGVALPSKSAYGKWIKLHNPANSLTTRAQVVDTGPFCTDDEDYVFGNARPRAERLEGQFCPTTVNGKEVPTVPDGKGGWRKIDISNGAGIDIFARVARELKIKPGENVDLEWCWDDEDDGWRWPYQ